MKLKLNLKKTRNIITTICLTVIIFTVTKMVDTSDQKAINTNASGLDNKSVGWGIKRTDNHEQPDLGAKNKELIEKYNGMAMGDKEKKYIYLTFDAGYEAGYTENILNVLKEKNVVGTFFITAHYANTAPDLVKRIIDEGHIVGNHTPKYLMSGK